MFKGLDFQCIHAMQMTEEKPTACMKVEIILLSRNSIRLLSGNKVVLSVAGEGKSLTETRLGLIEVEL